MREKLDQFHSAPRPSSSHAIITPITHQVGGKQREMLNISPHSNPRIFSPMNIPRSSTLSTIFPKLKTKQQHRILNSLKNPQLKALASDSLPLVSVASQKQKMKKDIPNKVKLAATRRSSDPTVARPSNPAPAAPSWADLRDEEDDKMERDSSSASPERPHPADPVAPPARKQQFKVASNRDFLSIGKSPLNTTPDYKSYSLGLTGPYNPMSPPPDEVSPPPAQPPRAPVNNGHRDSPDEKLSNHEMDELLRQSERRAYNSLTPMIRTAVEKAKDSMVKAMVVQFNGTDELIKNGKKLHDKSNARLKWLLEESVSVKSYLKDILEDVERMTERLNGAGPSSAVPPPLASEDAVASLVEILAAQGLQTSVGEFLAAGITPDLVTLFTNLHLARQQPSASLVPEAPVPEPPAPDAPPPSSEVPQPPTNLPPAPYPPTHVPGWNSPSFGRYGMNNMGGGGMMGGGMGGGMMGGGMGGMMGGGMMGGGMGGGMMGMFPQHPPFGYHGHGCEHYERSHYSPAPSREVSRSVSQISATPDQE